MDGRAIVTVMGNVWYTGHGIRGYELGLRTEQDNKGRDDTRESGGAFMFLLFLSNIFLYTRGTM